MTARVNSENLNPETTLDPAYNEFGYNRAPAYSEQIPLHQNH